MTTLLNFVLHMVQNPDVQAKAHEELDRVIGRGRMPDFSDKENLPYIRAIYMETLRHLPALPLGFPHRLIVDDEYRGMHLPEGSVVFANSW